MKSLNEDLKTGQFKQIYLLYGEESYLKKQYKDRLSKAILAEGDTMNYKYYEGKGINTKEVIDLAETMPFFAERRVIVIEDSQLFKSSDPDFADYMKQLPDTAYFIFVESEIDKRNRLYKVVKEKGRIVELGRQDSMTLLRWILGAVKREGKQITEQTVRHFLGKVGDDMENIQAELEKLFSYTLDQAVISIEDVEAICTTHITNQIFDMVNAVAEGRQRQALEFYYDLLALKEPPMRILFLMSRQFKLLMEVKELSARGCQRKEISEKAKVPPFAVAKYQAQGKAFSKEALRSILEECAATEEAVKTGQITDALAVELFIVEHSSRKEKGR